MKKFFILAFVSCIAMFSISCGGKGSDKADGVTTLTAYIMVDLGAPDGRATADFLESFNTLYPDIKVEFEFANHESFMSKAQAMSAANTLPDLFSAYPGKRTGFFYESGQALELSPYLTENLKANFTSETWEQSDDGSIYIIPPYHTATHIIFANNLLMKELGITFPKTHEELISQAEIAKKAGYTLLGTGDKEDWVLQSVFFGMLVDRFGGKEWIDDARVGRAKFTDAPFIKSFAIIKELLDKGVFNQGVVQLTLAEAFEEFVQQKSIYFMNGNWQVATARQTLTAEQLDNITFHVYPALPGEVTKSSSTSIGGTGIAINSKIDKSKIDAAMKLLLHFSGEAGAAFRIQELSQPSSYILDATKYDLDTITKRYVEFTADTPMGYVFDSVMEAEGCMGVINPGIQAILLGIKTPEQLAEEYENWVSKNEPSRK